MNEYGKNVDAFQVHSYTCIIYSGVYMESSTLSWSTSF